jgi:salicylate hydroxylase
MQHAMPPQGESTGIVFEDTVIFSRILARWLEKSRTAPETPMSEAFEAYTKLRKPRIHTAYDESQSVLRTVSDAGWFGHTVKTYVVPWYLWWTRRYREKHFVEDVTTSELGY